MDRVILGRCHIKSFLDDIRHVTAAGEDIHEGLCFTAIIYRVNSRVGLGCTQGVSVDRVFDNSST